MPRLVFIADRFTEPDRADRAVIAVRAGVRWVHLRDHHAEPAVFDRAVRTIVRRLRDVSDAVEISVNARLDVAASLGLHLHVGWRGSSVEAARQRLGDNTLIGYSAHEPSEAQADRPADADYFFFSPVYPTASKPDHPGVGLSALKAFCVEAQPRPVLALGGITPDRVPVCRAAGAHGVAVLSGIMAAEDADAASQAYLRALADEASVREGGNW